MSSAQTSGVQEIWGGVALLAAALAAIAVVNLGGAEAYTAFLEYPVTIGLAPLVLVKSVHHWINDGLMALFFLLVGIEIQREVRMGTLRDPRHALVPIVAALGGVVVPALVYVALVAEFPALWRGWSIPTATDIAFAVALITALRNYVPTSLRVFLLALAVVDDLVAILVIALFYTSELVWMNLFLAGMGVALLVIKRRLRIQNMAIYAVMGLFMWVCVLKSGVHATVAGVLLGAVMPLRKHGQAVPASEQIEAALGPWVRWVILPLFAFANVGINLEGMSLQAVFAPLTLAIAGGLLIGKQIGVFGSVWVLEKSFGVPRPRGATWRHIYGVACVCGIGFTMSLFVGSLAFPPDEQLHIRVGVLVGSLLSALLATFILRW